MELQPFEAEVGEPRVLGVLPAQDLAVPGHGAAEAEQVVEAAAGALGDGGVRDRRHHQRDVEVPPPHGHVAQLVGGLGGEDDVVHDDEDGPFDVAPPQLLLLFQQFVDEGLVPVVEEEGAVPGGVQVHQGLQRGAARRRAHEGDHHFEVVKQSRYEVHQGGALAAPSGAHRRQDDGQSLADVLGVERLEHVF